MIPSLSMVHQQDDAIYFFIDLRGKIEYARAVASSDGWRAEESWEVPILRTCQYCALRFDPQVTKTPRGYCSHECSKEGERPYNRASIKQFEKKQSIEEFARELVEKLHYLQHNNDDRFDCEWDLCIQAKIIGI